MKRLRFLAGYMLTCSAALCVSLLYACGGATGPGPDTTLNVRDTTRVTVVVHEISGYSVEQDAFARRAAARLERVVNSAEFRTALLRGKFRNTNGRSSSEILDSILAAVEVQGPGGKPGVLDLRLRTVSSQIDGDKWMRNCELGSRAGTIGIDGSGTGITATCACHLELWRTGDKVGAMAGHLMHEYMHQLGYSHSWFRRAHSAVYQVGNLVEELVVRGVGSDTPPQ